MNITLNVKNELVYKLGFSDGSRETTYFVDYLKTLAPSDVFLAIDKKKCCKAAMQRVPFGVQIDLRNAVRNNKITVKFGKRRGYTAVIFTF